MIKIVLLVILTIIILVLLFFDYFYRYVYLKKFYNSFLWVRNKSSYLIAIIGAIRKGKTTFMFGLMHIFSLVRKRKLEENMEEIENIVIQINFDVVRKKFYELLEKNDFNFDFCFYYFFDVFLVNENSILYSLDQVEFDGLKKERDIKLLKKYLFYYYHYVRKNFVYSDVPCYNQISCNYSLKFDNEWIKLKNKDSVGKHNFPLEEYSLFLYDEQLLENSNINAISKLNDDNGSDIFYRLFGQIFRENCYYLTTLQNATRWKKNEREIIQQFIYIRERKLININPIKSFFYRNFMQLLFKINNFLNKKDNMSSIYFSKISLYKKLNKKYLLWEKRNISNSFLKFDVSIYSDVESVGKKIDLENEDENNYTYTFFIPVCYCWDVGDTHLFYKLYKYLVKNSLLKIKDVGLSELDDEKIVNILTKYKEKNAVKESELKDEYFV